MMLHTIAIVLVHAVLAVQGGNLFQKNSPAHDIEALCAGKPVELVSFFEIRYLESIVRHSSCSKHVRAAIWDLSDLTEDTQKNMCAQASIDKLRQFYSKYLDTSTEENKQREQLPKSLRDFALAYGMQMSSVCKTRMVNALTNPKYNVLDTQAHETIKNLVSDKSPVAELLEGLAGPDEILLPADLAPFIKRKQHAEGANLEDDTIYVQSATGPYIRELQANCNQVFAPIYKPLITPIVQLVNMGFNYKNKPLRSDMSYSRTSKPLAKWSRLVFLCESLNNIRIVNVPKQVGSADAEGETVRILTKEEAAALDDTSVLGPLPQVAERTHKFGVLNKFEILDKKDKKLMKAVEEFSTSKSEDEKIAARMTGKSVSMLKAWLKRHSFGLSLSKDIKAIVHRIKTGEKLKPNDELVKILDGANGHESEFKDSSLDTALDNSQDFARDMPGIVKDIAAKVGYVLAEVVMCILYVALAVVTFGLVVLDTFLQPKRLID